LNALQNGIGNPAFAIGTAVFFVVIIDAMDLRKKIERLHRVLKTELSLSEEVKKMRDRMGHTPIEVLVVRFRHLHPSCGKSQANVGIKRTTSVVVSKFVLFSISARVTNFETETTLASLCF
jgi:hypothetical protein